MRSLSFVLLSLLFGIATVLLVVNGCGGGNQDLTLAGKFEHIVIIVQENRTPDNLFHDPVLIKAGADIADTGVNSLGQSIPLQAVPLGLPYDFDHSHKSFVRMFDGGKMVGANHIPGVCYAKCAPTQGNFKYVRPEDVQPYYEMAEQYSFADRMFQTNQGPSFPAHQFIISGTSAPQPGSRSFLAENATGIPSPTNNTGCTAPP